MSHEITVRENGIAEAAFAGQKAWHGLGANVTELMSAREALRTAHLDWDVRLRPLWVRSMENEKAFQIEDKQAVCRADNGVYLGTVGMQYTPLQNTDQCDFIEALVGEGAVVECVGSLFKGRRTFWTVKVPNDLVINDQGRDDVIQKYLILANAHDGTMSFKAFWSPIRVVCNNTLSASLRGSRNGVSIRHTKGAKNKVQEARSILGLADKYYNQLGAAFEAFADTRIDQPTYKNILTEVFGDETDEELTKGARTGIENTKATITDNLKMEVTALGKGRITLWDAYNSITYYTSHQMTRRATGRLNDANERRFESVLMGNGSRNSKTAFEACRKQLSTAIN